MLSPWRYAQNVDVPRAGVVWESRVTLKIVQLSRAVYTMGIISWAAGPSSHRTDSGKAIPVVLYEQRSVVGWLTCFHPSMMAVIMKLIGQQRQEQEMESVKQSILLVL